MTGRPISEQDYRIQGNRSLDRALLSIKHLRGHFGGYRAIDIPGEVGKYIIKRQVTAKPATVRLELAALKRSFALAWKRWGLGPFKFPTIRVENTRQGFFEEPEIRAVLYHLPDYLQPMVEFLYLTGWRRGEAVSLEWRQVDFQGGTIRLEGTQTKNKSGRTFPLDTFPTLLALLEEQRDRTKELERRRAIIVSRVFIGQAIRLSTFVRPGRTPARLLAYRTGLSTIFAGPPYGT